MTLNILLLVVKQMAAIVDGHYYMVDTLNGTSYLVTVESETESTSILHQKGDAIINKLL